MFKKNENKYNDFYIIFTVHVVKKGYFCRILVNGNEFLICKTILLLNILATK